MTNPPDKIILPTGDAPVVLYNGHCYARTDRKGQPDTDLADITKVFDDCDTCGLSYRDIIG